jgi:hypothetical protein
MASTTKVFLLAGAICLVAAASAIGYRQDQMRKEVERVTKERDTIKASMASAPVDLRPSQLTSAKYRVSFVNASSSITDVEMERVGRALQRQVHEHLSPVWGVDADLELVKKGQRPRADAWRMIVQDEPPPEVIGALGYHEVVDGLPIGRVFVKLAKADWTVTASHELLSLLTDPRNNLVDDENPRFYAYEVPDPCEAETYQIDGVAVSDFVFPAWFEPRRKPGTAQFDYLKLIKKPLEILRGGYASLLDAKGGQWRQEFK